MKTIPFYREVLPGYFDLDGEVPAPSAPTDLGEVKAIAAYKKISGRIAYDFSVPDGIEKNQPLSHIEVRDGKVFSVSYIQDGMVRENIISQYLGNGQWSIPKQY